MKKKPQFLFIAIGLTLLTLLGAAVIIVLVFFPNAFNGAFKTTYEKEIFQQSIESNQNKRTISVSYEIVKHSKTADALRGYRIKLIDPGNGNILDQVFIKRYLSWMPEKKTEVIVTSDNQIWMIEASERDVLVLYDEYKPNNFEGFAALIKLNNDKLEVQKMGFLQGWTIIGVNKNNASMRNLFNQDGCLDYSTHVISITKCPTY